MIEELAKLCEHNNISLSFSYDPSDMAWSVEAYDKAENGNTRLFYDSFIFKGSFATLLQNAFNAIAEYVANKKLQ